MDINTLPTQYIKTNDGHIGVIVGQTKTQIIACLPWSSRVRFMKASHRQVGTPTRTFTCIWDINTIEDELSY
jgi:hypothetical protein